MSSAIDPTKPADGVAAVKADLRNNLQAAKAEIEALQVEKGTANTWARVEETTAARAIDDADHERWVECTHTAGMVSVTLSAATMIGKEGGVVKATGDQPLVLAFAPGATQVLPQNPASAEPITLKASHGFRWRCIDNVDGSSARYLVELLDHRHAGTLGFVPATLEPQHSGWIFRVSATGTTTVPAGATLRAGFNCTLVNPTGSGFTLTLDAPGPINVAVAAGETATIDVLDNHAIVVSKGAHTVIG
jgi:hypothetical protein